MTLPGIPLGVIASVWLPPGVRDSLLGVALGGGILWLIAEAYFRWRKVEGMGFGDVKMLAMIGAVLGWRAVIVTLVLASCSGALIGVAMLSRGKADGHAVRASVRYFLVGGRPRRQPGGRASGHLVSVFLPIAWTSTVRWIADRAAPRSVRRAARADRVRRLRLPEAARRAGAGVEAAALVGRGVRRRGDPVGARRPPGPLRRRSPPPGRHRRGGPRRRRRGPDRRAADRGGRDRRSRGRPPHARRPRRLWGLGFSATGHPFRTVLPRRGRSWWTRWRGRRREPPRRLRDHRPGGWRAPGPRRRRWTSGGARGGVVVVIGPAGRPRPRRRSTTWRSSPAASRTSSRTA